MVFMFKLKMLLCSAPKVAFADTISLTDGLYCSSLIDNQKHSFRKLGASANIHLQEITAAVLQQHGICRYFYFSC